MRYTLRPLTRPGPTTARRRSPFSASWSDTLEVLARAIAMTLEALRAVDRYGAASSGEQYSGWRQIGSGPSTALVPDPPWTRRDAALKLWAAAYPQREWNPNATVLIGFEDDEQGVAIAARRAQRNTHPDTQDERVTVTFDQVQRAIAVLRGGS